MSLAKTTRIYVAGHRGLVGSALVRRLQHDGFTNILTATREQLDLRDQAAVHYWFRANRPEVVFLVAGTVGGILANATRPAESCSKSAPSSSPRSRGIVTPIRRRE